MRPEKWDAVGGAFADALKNKHKTNRLTCDQRSGTKQGKGSIRRCLDIKNQT
jgi:hypothetical protein